MLKGETNDRRKRFRAYFSVSSHYYYFCGIWVGQGIFKGKLGIKEKTLQGGYVWRNKWQLEVGLILIRVLFII